MPKNRERQKANKKLGKKLEVYNPSHCFDLTAYTAINHADNDIKRKKE